jgi:signal transduction histidine kinase
MDHDIKAVMDILLYMSQTIDDFRSFFVKDRLKKEFVLQEVVEKTLHLTKSAFIDKNITVSLEADPDVRATGYPNEYAQALLNILYNARDVLLERAVAVPRIEITIKRTEGRSLVTVQDNGGGIGAEVMPRIFEPYFSTKGPSQGTGIGLYMAKTIIEHNMGGKLTAANTGTGAEFSIEL